MKSILGHALVLATILAVPVAMADETKTKSTTTTSTTDPAAAPTTGSATSTTTVDGTTEGVTGTTTTDSTTTTTQPLAPVDPAYTATPPAVYGGGPATTTTTTATTTETSGVAHDDTMVVAHADDDTRPRVKKGIGFNVFGAAGARDSARLGLGARIEFVMPFGLTLGGSYTQHWEAEGGRTGVRPLLGEVGVAIPVAKRLELRPMVGLGYAFVSSSGSSDATAVNDNSTTSATVRTSGFDVAPGAKISYLAGNVIEIYTLPKYHFISGNNFAGVELGAGARF